MVANCSAGRSASSFGEQLGNSPELGRLESTHGQGHLFFQLFSETPYTKALLENDQVVIDLTDRADFDWRLAVNRSSRSQVVVTGADSQIDLSINGALHGERSDWLPFKTIQNQQYHQLIMRGICFTYHDSRYGDFTMVSNHQLAVLSVCFVLLTLLS